MSWRRLWIDIEAASSHEENGSWDTQVFSTPESECVEFVEAKALDELRREIEWLQDEIINLRLLKDPEIVDDVKDIAIAHLRNVIERLKAKLAECEVENEVELDKMKRWNDENAGHAQRFLVERDKLKAKLSMRDNQLARALKEMRGCPDIFGGTMHDEALAEIEKMEADHDQAK